MRARGKHGGLAASPTPVSERSEDPDRLPQAARLARSIRLFAQGSETGVRGARK